MGGWDGVGWGGIRMAGRERNMRIVEQEGVIR